MFTFLNGLLLSGETETIASTVADAVRNVQMGGILEELISLLPVVLPVVIGFIGIRKGISFLIGSLRRA